MLSGLQGAWMEPIVSVRAARLPRLNEEKFWLERHLNLRRSGAAPRPPLDFYAPGLIAIMHF